MKILLIKSAHCVAEEGGSGTSEYPEIPAQMVLTAQYLSDLGFDVTMRDVFEDEIHNPDFAEYDVTVSWVPVIGRLFFAGIKFLEKAKESGRLTVLILNDAYDGMEKECLEQYSFIDFAVRLYEREIVLGKLIHCLEKSGDLEGLPGILYRKNGAILDTGLHPPLENLFHLKAADRFLRQLPLIRYNVGKLDVARGCPFQCVFCQYRGTRRRKRNVDDIIKELKVMEGYYDLTWLHELNMMIDKPFTKDICKGIIDSGIKINWSTDARMGSCDDIDLLRLMRRSGCVSLDFGLECVNEQIRNNNIRKNLTNVEIDMAIRNCLLAGIRPSINLMLGSPWESVETMRETEAFLKKYPYVDNVQLTRPQRGTPLYEIFREEGLLGRDLHLEDYIASRDYPICPTKFLSREELYRWYWKFSIQVISRHAVLRLKRLGFRRFAGQMIRKRMKPYYVKVIFNILKDKFIRHNSSKHHEVA